MLMGKKGYDITKDYVATGNKAIDGVASCIIWHRERKIPLKAIHLRQPYYDWFRKGIEILQGKGLEDEQELTFDAVNIEKGHPFQKEAILPELWNSIN